MYKVVVSVLVKSSWFFLFVNFSDALAQENIKLSGKLQQQMIVTAANETIPVMIYLTDKGNQLDNKRLTTKQQMLPGALKRRILNRGEKNAIKFQDIPLESRYVSQIKSRVHKIRHQLRMLNAISAEATPQAILEILEFEFVKRVDVINRLKREPQDLTQNTIFKTTQSQPPMAASKAMLEYGSSFTQNEQLNVPQLHDMGLSGNGIVIAVLDSGFNRLSHESFNQIDIAGTWDFVNNDGNVGDESDMGIGSHGTHTLSTIGGFSPGQLIGPAYGATYYLAKTENTESELHVEEDNWCAAAEWADDNGAHIITSSLGYTVFDQGINYSPSDMDGDTTIVTQCADLAADSGIVVVNSAGNSGNASQENTIGAPSDGHSVLAVGAINSNGSRVGFSSYGPSADGRIKPDVMAMGASVFVASATSDVGYINVNGTSFSCPLTAGVAALLLEASPNLTASQVRELLRNSASQASSPDNLNGYGVVNGLAAVFAADGRFIPEASFDLNIVQSTTVQFTNTSTDSDGTVVSFLWDFGDGNSSNAENPTHTYNETGTYSVRLMVTDNEGLQDDVSLFVSVVAEEEVTRSSGSGGLGFMLLICFAAAVYRKACH